GRIILNTLYRSILMNSYPIVVFDSGIGSISVIREIKRELPNENLIYFADKANFPYGKKSQIDLFKIVHNTIKYLERFHPKLIIIASNTPSIQVIDKIRSLTNIPLMGIKPPIKKAIKITKKNHIGIMATESSINSKELDELIKLEIPQDIFVSKYNASSLIPLIEDGTFLRNRKKIEQFITQILGNIDNIDVITLSSTHLPFILDQLNQIYPHVKFLDPAESIVKDLKKFLIDNNLNNKIKNGKMRILVSDNKKKFQEILRQIGRKEKIEEVFWSI
ncbi:MAG: glutamate racemase, partial [Nitrososphaeraceae archaeon]|nr:glutamate racemase [Nitrososphaeraceae archaeon]